LQRPWRRRRLLLMHDTFGSYLPRSRHPDAQTRLQGAREGRSSRRGASLRAGNRRRLIFLRGLAYRAEQTDGGAARIITYSAREGRASRPIRTRGAAVSARCYIARTFPLHRIEHAERLLPRHFAEANLSARRSALADLPEGWPGRRAGKAARVGETRVRYVPDGPASSAGEGDDLALHDGRPSRWTFDPKPIAQDVDGQKFGGGEIN